LAETIWDAIEAGTMDSLPKRNAAPLNKVKVSNATKDFRRIGFADMILWIRSQGVLVRGCDAKKERAIALAERTWDAIECDTLDELKSEYNSRCGQQFKEAEVSSEEEL